MEPVKGIITAIRGGAVEVWFEGALPPLHALLLSTRHGARLEVVEERNADTLAAIALSSLEGVERGEEVEVAGGEISVSLSRDICGRMFDESGKPIDGKPFQGTRDVSLFGGSGKRRTLRDGAEKFWKPASKSSTSWSRSAWATRWGSSAARASGKPSS